MYATGLILELILLSTSSAFAHESESLPEPTVTHTEKDARSGETVAHGELISKIDATRQALHALHHPHGIIENRRIPGDWKMPAMKSVPDFALSEGRPRRHQSRPR